MPKKGKRRQGRRRGTGRKLVNSKFYNLISTVANSGPTSPSTVSWTYAAAMPDIASSRTIIVHRVVSTWEPVSATTINTGGSGQIQLLGPPFALGTSAGGRYGTMSWVSLKPGTTRMSVVTRPAQWIPVDLDQSANFLQIQAFSALQGTWTVNVTIWYELLIDLAMTSVSGTFILGAPLPIPLLPQQATATPASVVQPLPSRDDEEDKDETVQTVLRVLAAMKVARGADKQLSDASSLQGFDDAESI